MGKLAKPQRSKKHKKIKTIDPFHGRKDSRSETLNQKPKHYDQEVPRKLKNLGFTINGIRSGKVGKRSKNKFLKHPDGPPLLQGKLSKHLEGSSSQSSTKPAKAETRKKVVEQIKGAEKSAEPDRKDRKTQNAGKGKKDGKSKISEEVLSDYVDNLQPVRPFVEPFNFKRKSEESERQFNNRVNTQANRALTKAKIDEHFDIPDEKKLQQKMTQVKKGMSDKKKQRLKEKKVSKMESMRERKLEKSKGFAALQDKVEFGEVVHAPPELSVRPKKAAVSDKVDRPGSRMPELKAMIAANMRESVELHSQQHGNESKTYDQKQGRHRGLGSSLKRRDLTVQQQREADSKREMAIEAYRLMKKKIKT